MSTNIHIKASRQIIVVKTGKTDMQTVYFNQWQTPSVDTYAIMESKDPIQAYKDWALREQEDQVENVYAEDDYFEEGEPIGTRTFNYGKEHVAEFEAWIREVEEAGYIVEFEAW